MGKSTGFLEYKRKAPGCRPIKERVKDYKEVNVLQPESELSEQGARCMDCGIPYCHSMGCPVSNLIPEWNDLIYRGFWKEAFERLEYTNNLPEVTGRVCPAPCEASCTLSINEAPVTIKQIECSIIEHAFKEGWVKPRIAKCKTNKKVAVVGSGPAGIAAAQQLARAGHSVTLFEKDNKIGGTLRYGIPDFKLEKSILDRRIELMKEEGVYFETDVEIGVDISPRYLQKTFDAVVLTLGAREPRDLPVDGRELDGVHFAMDFLTLSNKYVSKEISKKDIISAKDKTVLVIGGGDTGSDCVGTSVRQGAKKIYQFEIMPKPLDWKEDTNPNWPYWPMILRTSSSHQEGCERDWSILTKSLIGKNGTVTGGNFIRVEWERDDSGRFSMKEIKGSEFSLKVDLVLLAMGFVHVEHSKLVEGFGLKLTPQGNIDVKSNYETSVKGIFSAGDATTGASLVVRAIDHGRKAAAYVDEYLTT